MSRIGKAIDLGLMDYQSAYRLQKEFLEKRKNNKTPDFLLLVSHPPVITVGRTGEAEHVLADRSSLGRKGVDVFEIDRGGDVTFHGPGQIVAYPILDLKEIIRDVHKLMRMYEQVIILLLAEYGIKAGRRDGFTGVWVDGRKIASIGIGVSRWTTFHGFALNVFPEKEYFDLIVPCGIGNVKMTSIAEETGRPVEIPEVKEKLINAFAGVFDMKMEKNIWRQSLPEWLRQKAPCQETFSRTRDILVRWQLNTVCAGAHCPNSGECFSSGTAAFMILGDRCTRHCRFCAVGHKTGLSEPDPEEPLRLANAASELKLRHVVITSVTRDDIPDGGAKHFADTVKQVRAVLPKSTIEVLTPDFKGQVSALKTVIDAGPDIFNHNLETVPRLYPMVSPEADYKRSIGILKEAKKLSGGRITTKSGLMAGFGETTEEILSVMDDLKDAGCDVLTIGQYLRPSPEQLAVIEFILPEKFREYEEQGRKRGFKAVSAGPFVRSSYHAGETVEALSRA